MLSTDEATTSASRRKTVAVIGTGAAGLATLSVLRRKFDVTAFERSDRVGGVWNYFAETDRGPMYSALRTNLPKEVMAFPDWEWREPDGRSFLRHERVLEYLRSYCYDQGLDAFIRFGHSVVSVRPLEPRGWIVETSEGGSQSFDAVVLANGHYAKPLVPKVPGADAFPADKASHSCAYRHAEEFRDKVVALLGAGSSGQDIALELATTAKRVLLCHRGPPLRSPLPDNVTQLGPIERLTADGCIVCSGGPGSEETMVPVDHVMFCTGYDYYFPFLDQSVAATEPSHVPNLYMHVAHCQRPGLFFLGLCTIIVPFPQFYLQARLIEALLEGRAALPDDAAAVSQQEVAEKLAAGVSARHLHTLSDNQWDYNDRLADLAECSPLPRMSRVIYDHVKLERRLRLRDYKRLAYRVTGPDMLETFKID